MTKLDCKANKLAMNEEQHRNIILAYNMSLIAMQQKSKT